MSKIKLLMFIETLGRGGAERVLVNTLPELQKLGIDCEVAILFNRADLAEELEEKNIKVHKINLSYKWNIFEGLIKLNTLVKKNKYDIIHAHLFFAYFYTGLLKCFNKKIKTVITFHNLAYNAYPANTFLKKIRKKIDCLIQKYCFNLKTSVSKAVKEHYSTHCGVKDIKIIYNSFPIDELNTYKKNINKREILSKYINNILDSHFIILTPGRLVKEKGHKYLIEAAKILNEKYNNFLFIFVGKGPLENTLKKQSFKNIIFINELKHSELMKIYNEVDLVVIPSVHEAFGLVIGESMIMEKPIISTNIDAIRELITNNKEGLLVNPKDPKALAQAIERLYLNENLRLLFSKNAKEKIKKFDVNYIAKKWFDFYKELLNG